MSESRKHITLSTLYLEISCEENEILQHVLPTEADVDIKGCTHTDSDLVYGCFVDYKWRVEEFNRCTSDWIRWCGGETLENGEAYIYKKEERNLREQPIWWWVLFMPLNCMSLLGVGIKSNTRYMYIDSFIRYCTVSLTKLTQL